MLVKATMAVTGGISSQCDDKDGIEIAASLAQERRWLAGIFEAANDIRLAQKTRFLSFFLPAIYTVATLPSPVAAGNGPYIQVSVPAAGKSIVVQSDSETSRTQQLTVAQLLADYGLILPNLANATAQLQEVLLKVQTELGGRAAEWADTKADTEQSAATVLEQVGIQRYVSDAARIADLGNRAEGDWAVVYSATGGTYYRKTSGAWVQAGTSLNNLPAATAEAGKIQAQNIIPQGLNPLNSGWLTNLLTDATYSVNVAGPVGPFGLPTLKSEAAKWLTLSAATSAKVPIPGPVRFRVYLKLAAGHLWNLRITVYDSSGVRIGAASTAIATNLAATSTTLDGYTIHEFTYNAWAAGAVTFTVNFNLNYTSVSGQSELAGIVVIRDGAYFAVPLAMLDGQEPDLLSPSEVRRALYTPSPYPLPTAADDVVAVAFSTSELGVNADVNSFLATNDFNILRRSTAMIDAIFAIRDDKRSPLRADFRGVIRKNWGTDRFQIKTDGNALSGNTGFTNPPPHPGVYIHFPLHTGLTIYPLLCWVEAVLYNPSPPADLVTKANAYKTLCLESLHDMDGNYADSTHISNTDPDPMVTGEGRYFMSYDAGLSGGLRDGYGYLPGGTEQPFNMDLASVAALYVAYRITRGTNNTASAESLAFKAKADGIMKRFKRSLYSYGGYTGWAYQRQGSWRNYPWTNATPANNPYLIGVTQTQQAGATNPISPQGEDLGHVTYAIRGVVECYQTSDVLTANEVAGIARTLMSGFWWNPGSQKRYFLDTPTNSQGTLTITQQPVAASHEYAALAGFDARIAGALRAWYTSRKLTPGLSVGVLKLNGIL